MLVAAGKPALSSKRLTTLPGGGTSSAVGALAGPEHQFGDLGSGGRGRCGCAARGWAEAAHAARTATAAGRHGLGTEADAEEFGGDGREGDSAGAGGDGYRGLKVLAVV